MPDSDDEYVQGASDDDADAHVVTRGGRSGRRRGARGSGGEGAAGQDGDGEGGFEVNRTWEDVVEDEDGTISGAVEGILEGGKRRRLLKDTTPLQRGIIRHLVVVLDMSSFMMEKDYRPTRYLLMIRYAQEFVAEYFEQNPISQLAILAMRDGLAVRVSDMGGNPAEHAAALASWRDKEPEGNPSLQNALEMARGALFHAPAHGTREVLLIFGALFTADPGDIHATISALVSSRIACSVVGLAAEVAVCRTLVQRTNPAASTAAYSVAMNEQHFRELFMAATTPPPTASDEAAAKKSLLMMGFPSRTMSEHPTLCACHSQPSRGGYLCPRCHSKACTLPCKCQVCDLTLILSTHLARSYHHLFPLQNWLEVSWDRVRQRQREEGVAEASRCFSCLVPFPSVPSEKQADGDGGVSKEAAIKAHKPGTMRDTNISESGRYECGTCGRFFCIDCDLFSHSFVHNCPGCQSREGILAAQHAAAADIDMGDAAERA